MNDLVFRFKGNACRQADAFHFFLLKKRCDDLVKNKKLQIFVWHELHGRAGRKLHHVYDKHLWREIYSRLFFRASM